MRVLGGATGEEEEAFLITELKASSRTSKGLLGLISKGVSRSTLPESTRESRILELLVGSRRLVGVGVSRPACKKVHCCHILLIKSFATAFTTLAAFQKLTSPLPADDGFSGLFLLEEEEVLATTSVKDSSLATGSPSKLPKEESCCKSKRIKLVK